jgi:hypothetical protein
VTWFRGPAARERSDVRGRRTHGFGIRHPDQPEWPHHRRLRYGRGNQGDRQPGRVDSGRHDPRIPAGHVRRRVVGRRLHG